MPMKEIQLGIEFRTTWSSPGSASATDLLRQAALTLAQDFGGSAR